eukprot:2178804-Pleurochrysis_carterae.AAC.1
MHGPASYCIFERKCAVSSAEYDAAADARWPSKTRLTFQFISHAASVPFLLLRWSPTSGVPGGPHVTGVSDVYS